MRAKTVNEVQNFERGNNPRSAMGIGGVQFGVEKFKMKQKLKNDWADFVRKTLIGKTISGTFNKWSINPDTKMPDAKWGEYTVKVKEVSNLDLDDQVIIVSDSKNQYYVPVGEEKIIIE